MNLIGKREPPKNFGGSFRKLLSVFLCSSLLFGQFVFSMSSPASYELGSSFPVPDVRLQHSEKLNVKNNRSVNGSNSSEFLARTKRDLGRIPLSPIEAYRQRYPDFLSNRDQFGVGPPLPLPHLVPHDLPPSPPPAPFLQPLAPYQGDYGNRLDNRYQLTNSLSSGFPNPYMSSLVRPRGDQSDQTGSTGTSPDRSTTTTEFTPSERLVVPKPESRQTDSDSDRFSAASGPSTSAAGSFSEFNEDDMPRIEEEEPDEASATEGVEELNEDNSKTNLRLREREKERTKEKQDSGKTTAAKRLREKAKRQRKEKERLNGKTSPKKSPNKSGHSHQEPKAEKLQGKTNYGSGGKTNYGKTNYGDRKSPKYHRDVEVQQERDNDLGGRKTVPTTTTSTTTTSSSTSSTTEPPVIVNFLQPQRDHYGAKGYYTPPFPPILQQPEPLSNLLPLKPLRNPHEHIHNCIMKDFGGLDKFWDGPPGVGDIDPRSRLGRIQQEDLRQTCRPYIEQIDELRSQCRSAIEKLRGDKKSKKELRKEWWKSVPFDSLS